MIVKKALKGIFKEDIVILESLLMKSDYMSQKSFGDMMLDYKNNPEILGVLISICIQGPDSK